MDYIKDTISTTRITVCIMESHRARQEDALVEVMVVEDRPGASHPPGGSAADRRRGCCLNCAVALATVMGLVTVALVAGFVLHFFTSTTASCNQDSGPSNARAEFNVTWKQNESDEPGRYDICTVNKSANYLIYGAVRSPASDEVTLVQTRKNERSRTIQRRDDRDEGEFIFLEKVSLMSGTRISINFRSASPTSGHFLVFKLRV